MQWETRRDEGVFYVWKLRQAADSRDPTNSETFIILHSSHANKKVVRWSLSRSVCVHHHHHQPLVYSTWLPWRWKSARMSICQARSKEDLLHSNNSVGHVLIGWVKQGFMNHPLSPVRSCIIILTQSGKGEETSTHKKNSNTFSHKNTWVQKQPETTFTQKGTSSYMYANTEARCWSHLRNAKYLPLLSAWMAQPISSLSLLTVH